MAGPDGLDVSFIMVADAAQSVAGKVYILGGGWDRLRVPEIPGPPAVPFYVAVGLTVPWNLTNRKFSFSIELEDSDGETVAALVTGEAEVGRPPGIRPGTPQPVHLAGPMSPIFPSEGRYVLVCKVDGEPLGHTAIEVTEGGPQP